MSTESPIKLTPAQEQEISQMDPNAIGTYLREIAVAQGLAVRDPLNSEFIYENPVSSPKGFAKTEIIGGRKIIFESATPEGLERQIESAKHVAAEFSKPAKSDITPRNPDTGRFVATDSADDGADVAARAELDLRWRRGEISASEYIQQSGAVSDYLAEHGVTMDDLRGAAESNYEARWKSATEDFLSRHSEWTGGDAARTAIGNAVIELGLDGQPSVETLEKAYAHLLSTKTLPENPDVQREQAYRRDLDGAKSSQEIYDLTVKYYGGRRPGLLFGR